MQGAKKDVKSLPLNLREGTIPIPIFKKRSDFQRMTRHAAYLSNDGFVIQYLRQANPENQCHIGFTASRKVGNAVIRNKCKRRLRALVNQYLPQFLRHDLDYIFIARHTTASAPYAIMEEKFIQALQKISQNNITCKKDMPARKYKK